MEQILGLPKGWQGQRGHKKSLAITSSWWDVGNSVESGGLRIIRVCGAYDLLAFLLDDARTLQPVCTESGK